MKENNRVLYITVLDFEEGRVYQYGGHNTELSFDGDKLEDFITNMGHNLTNCEWMEHSNPIVITK
jgi:hypothetical protein